MANTTNTTPKTGLSNSLKGALWAELAGSLVTGLTGFATAKAERRYSRAVADTMRANAEIVKKRAEAQRLYNIDSAVEAINTVTDNSNRLEAEQITAIAANQGDIGSFQSQQITQETQRLELADIQAIRSNLAKQNFEIKKEADINVIDLLGKASMADLQADSATAKAWGQFGSSLLSTGLDVVAKRELYSLKMDK